MPRFWTKQNPLSHERLMELLRYDPQTGHFCWRVDRNSYGGKAKAGSRAGRLDKHGYRYIGIDGGVCQAHTLAWLYVHKKWPDCQIDHRNMIADDNWIDNLHEATMTLQRANQCVRQDSKTGIKGVQKTANGRYSARIRKSGIQYRLGTYDTTEEASAAYAVKATELFGEFARAV